MKSGTKYLVHAAVIAALYVVFTLISSLFGLASGPVQFRLSEALCILPCFTPAAVPGLVIGCFLSNLLSGGVIFDAVFGALATLLGAVGTRLLRKNRFLAVLPPIISNTLIVPFILSYVYGMKQAVFLLMLSVGIGEVVTAGILGIILYSVINRRLKHIFD